MSGSGRLLDHQKHRAAGKRVDHSLFMLSLHRCLCCDSTVLSQISALTTRAAIRAGLDPADTAQQWPLALLGSFHLPCFELSEQGKLCFSL